MMFTFSLWTRLVALYITLLSLTTFAQARLESLFTSSVTSCSPPTTIVVQQFDVRYFAYNASVVFDITASSVAPVNVSAQISLNVYGMHPVNLTFDLCGDDKTLCPLPLYNFSGSGTLPVPSSYTSKIPAIAYKIPNLEGFAQLTLTHIEDNTVAACIQSTLSNGWSMNQPAVGITTGTFALIAILSSILYTIFTPSESGPAKWRMIDVIGFFQHIVMTSFIRLNYPTAYTAFTANFSWSMLLFRVTKFGVQVQDAIDRMRHRTGSHLSDSALDANHFINRKNSPYNMVARRPFQTTPTISLTQPKLQSGIPLYVNMLGISSQNAFTTLFIDCLFLLTVAIVLFGGGYFVIWLVARKRFASRSATGLKARYWSCISSIGLRFAIILLFPIATLTFFQWITKDSYLSIILSVISLLTILAILAYSIFSLMRIPRRVPHPDDLRSQSSFSSQTMDHFSSTLAESHNDRCWFFTIVPTITITFLKAIFIGFAQGSPLTSLIAILLLELIQFGLTIWMKPGLTRRADVFAASLSGVKILSITMLFAFLPSAGVKPIPRVIVAIAIAIIFAVTILFLVFNTVVNAIPFEAIRDAIKSKRRNGRWSMEIDSSYAGGDSREVVGRASEGDVEKQASRFADRFTLPTSFDKLRNKIRTQKRSISSSSVGAGLNEKKSTSQVPLDRHSRAAAVMNGDGVIQHSPSHSRTSSIVEPDSESVISFQTQSYATWSPTSPANWPPPASPSTINYDNSGFPSPVASPRSFTFATPVPMPSMPMPALQVPIPMSAPVALEKSKVTAMSTPTELALGKGMNMGLPKPKRKPVASYLNRVSSPPPPKTATAALEQEQEQGSVSFDIVRPRPRSMDM